VHENTAEGSDVFCGLDTPSINGNSACGDASVKMSFDVEAQLCGSEPMMPSADYQEECDEEEEGDDLMPPSPLVRPQVPLPKRLSSSVPTEPPSPWERPNEPPSPWERPSERPTNPLPRASRKTSCGSVDATSMDVAKIVLNTSSNDEDAAAVWERAQVPLSPIERPTPPLPRRNTPTACNMKITHASRSLGSQKKKSPPLPRGREWQSISASKAKSATPAQHHVRRLPSQDRPSAPLPRRRDTPTVSVVTAGGLNAGVRGASSDPAITRSSGAAAPRTRKVTRALTQTHPTRMALNNFGSDPLMVDI
jgi:hypothetical protein